MIQFDEHIFQMGWSHHLQRLPHGVVLSIVSWLNISTTIPRERCETQGKNMVKQQLVLKDERKHRKSKIHNIYVYIYIYVSLKQKQRGLRRFVWVDFLERDQSQENCLRCFSIFSNPTRVIWVPGIYICRLFMFVFLDFVNGDMDKNDIGCRNRNPQIARKTALSWFLLANIYSSKSIFQFLMFGPSMWWLEKDKLRYVYHELV